MTFPEGELPDVPAAAHAVVRDAKAAGVWVLGGGLLHHDQATTVDTDGTVRGGPYPGTTSYLGGFSILDAPSHDEAVVWAARIAVACRCAREVRELGDDPEA